MKKSFFTRNRIGNLTLTLRPTRNCNAQDKAAGLFLVLVNPVPDRGVFDTLSLHRCFSVGL